MSLQGKSGSEGIRGRGTRHCGTIRVDGLCCGAVAPGNSAGDASPRNVADLKHRPMPSYQSSVILKCELASLREFLGRPANLPSVTDPDLELKILTAPEVVSAGEKIEFRIMAYGFKQRATNTYTTVTECEITEVQLEGPLRAWTHRQLFEALDDGRTQLTDEVEFEPPGGMLGYMLTEARIRESVMEGMRARYEALTDLVDSGGIK